MINLKPNKIFSPIINKTHSGILTNAVVDSKIDMDLIDGLSADNIPAFSPF